MSNPETDPYAEVLKNIAATLKGIQTSLEHLTGAVEGVAESIEKAHEPEGDLGVHLVGALKDLTSALHKRAQQERSHQPQQVQRQQHQQNPRREDRRDRGTRPHEEQEPRDDQGDHEVTRHTAYPSQEESTVNPEQHTEAADRPQEGQTSPGVEKRPRPNNRRRRGGKPPAGKTPIE